tara:strand:- start:255 stop:407 length:153 start_codon:yes stop_codon:yes gene_type:complete
MIEEKKLSYYQKNKKHYKRGGKYYKYVPKSDRQKFVKVEVKHGVFLISFD